jgi:hypothetical protein
MMTPQLDTGTHCATMRPVVAVAAVLLCLLAFASSAGSPRLASQEDIPDVFATGVPGPRPRRASSDSTAEYRAAASTVPASARMIDSDVACTESAPAVTLAALCAAVEEAVLGRARYVFPRFDGS